MRANAELAPQAARRVGRTRQAELLSNLAAPAP